MNPLKSSEGAEWVNAGVMGGGGHYGTALSDL